MRIISRKNEKLGVFDTKLDTWILEPIYNHIHPDTKNEDFYIVKTYNDLYGIIKSNGTWMVKPIYDNITTYYEKYNCCIVRTKSKLYGVLKIDDNSWLIEPIYKYIRRTYKSDDTLIIRKDDKYGIIKIGCVPSDNQFIYDNYVIKTNNNLCRLILNLDKLSTSHIVCGSNPCEIIETTICKNHIKVKNLDKIRYNSIYSIVYHDNIHHNNIVKDNKIYMDSVIIDGKVHKRKLNVHTLNKEVLFEK